MTTIRNSQQEKNRAARESSTETTVIPFENRSAYCLIPNSTSIGSTPIIVEESLDVIKISPYDIFADTMEEKNIKTFADLINPEVALKKGEKLGENATYEFDIDFIEFVTEKSQNSRDDVLIILTSILEDWHSIPDKGEYRPMSPIDLEKMIKYLHSALEMDFIIENMQKLSQYEIDKLYSTKNKIKFFKSIFESDYDEF